MSAPLEPAPATRVQRMLRRALTREALVNLTGGLLLVGAIVFAGDELVRHLGELERRVGDLGAWSVCAYIVLLVLGTSVFVPMSVLTILAGVLFGFELGSLAAVAGYLLAALLQRALARRLLRARVAHFLARRPTLLAIQAAVLRREFGLQLLLRLTPLNPATVNYLLGASGVRLLPFLAASVVHVPNLAVEVYLGYAGKHAARLAESGAPGLHAREILMIVSLLACVAALLVVSRLARRAIAEAAAAASGEREDAR